MQRKDFQENGYYFYGLYCFFPFSYTIFTIFLGCKIVEQKNYNEYELLWGFRVFFNGMFVLFKLNENEKNENNKKMIRIPFAC